MLICVCNQLIIYLNPYTKGNAMEAKRPLRRVITTDKAIRQLQEYLGRFETIAFDCETTSPRGNGLDDDRFMFGYSIAVYDNDKWYGFYVPIRHKGEDGLFYEEPDNADPVLAIDLIKSLYGKELIVHNVSFEYRTFANEDIDRHQFRYHDTFAMAWLLDPSRDGGNGLKGLVKKKVGYTMTEFSSFGKGDPSLVPIGNMGPYAIDDVVQMGKLFHILEHEIVEGNLNKVYQEIYRELVPYSTDMSLHGIKVNISELKSLEKIWTAELLVIDEWFKKTLHLENLNLGSSKWLNEIMIVKFKLWPILFDMERGKSGNYSVGANNVKRWAKGERNTSKTGQICAEKLLRTKGLNKLISAYTKTLVRLSDDKNYCHPKLGPMGTKTGRWNCKDPNLQTVPSRSDDGQLIRKCFIADEGMALVGADYSQIEYRLLAHFTQSEPLVDAYLNNEDLHKRTASIVYDKPIDEVTDQERGRAKGVNFGIIYGQGPQALASVLGLTEDGAKKFLRRYFQLIPGVKDWMDNYKGYATDKGYTETLLGRRRYLPDLRSTGRGLRGAAERRVINTRIQGSAADLTNLAIRNLQREINKGKLPCSILLMVHDEIITTCKKEDAEFVAKRMTEIMESVVSLRVPLIAEAKIGQNLKETK